MIPTKTFSTGGRHLAGVIAGARVFKVKRSPGEGNGNPLQYPCLENPMDEEPGGLQSTGSQRVGHD